jgi:hypothetical protein
METELIRQLLQFSAEEYAPDSACPSEELLYKICEMKKWQVTGTYPHYIVNQWVDVTLGRSAHVRLLNSVKHIHLHPLNFENLIAGIETVLKQRKAFRPDEHFMDKLVKATQDLKPRSEVGQSMPPVYGLQKIFSHLQAQDRNLTRENFGLNLSFLIARPKLQHPRSLELVGSEQRGSHIFTLAIHDDNRRVDGLQWGTLNLNTLDI